MTNSSHALYVVDQKGEKVSRANALIAATFISLSGLAVMLLPQPAAASCYGTGYARRCDGRGGPNATYSSRGSNGSTTYYRSGNPYRKETYKTYYR